MAHCRASEHEIPTAPSLLMVPDGLGGWPTTMWLRPLGPDYLTLGGARVPCNPTTFPAATSQRAIACDGAHGKNWTCSATSTSVGQLANVWSRNAALSPLAMQGTP